MKNQELFNKTVDILVKAYKEGKLVHSECSACAVGNLVAAQHTRISLNDDGGQWFDMTNCALRQAVENGEKLSEYEQEVYEIAMAQIKSTGYTIEQLFQIEQAFEGVAIRTDLNFNKLTLIDPTGVLGLRAVYDVLCNIHEVDITTVAKAEEVFV